MSKRRRQHKDTERRDLRDRARMRDRRASEAGPAVDPTGDAARDFEPETFTPED